MSETMSRRALLGGAALGTGALLLGRNPISSATPLGRSAQAGVPLARGARFDQGVASGQPGTDAITLWSKLDGLQQSGRLQVEISPDAEFANVIYRKDVVADADSGFAVHHRAQGASLKPGEQYFYRFFTCEEGSPVGRFRTARPADSREPVRMAFFSCQAFEAGFYNAHEALAKEPDLDLIVCLGDYIYERTFYDANGVRKDTTGANKDSEVQTLPEYRDKYALYHSDPRLLELRRQFPMLTIWDDHEVEDNYARDKPGEATKNVRVPFLDRRANGYRAWFEHMPRVRVQGEPDRIYGRVPLGANAEIFLLDQRQYRDDQPCGDQFFVPCTESEAPGRTFLGRDQKEWLKGALADSRATWKLVGNEDMIMSLDGPPRNEINKDQWDGYAAEREELVNFIGARGIKDVSFITGDIHTYFAGNVTASGRQGAPTDPAPQATEFVTGSMTSEGIVPAQNREQSSLLVDSSVIANNPHIAFSEMNSKGYGIVEARPDELRVTYRAVRTTKQPTSEVFDLAEFRVKRGTPHVEIVRTAGGARRP